MKICIKCKKEKELDAFSKDKREKCGKLSICRKCRSKKRREKYHSSEYGKKKNAKYYQKYKKTEQCKINHRKSAKKFAQTDKGKAYRKKQSKKYRESFYGKMRKNFGGGLRNCLNDLCNIDVRNVRGYKSKFDILPYTDKEFVQHMKDLLLPEMKGNIEKISIDHVIPISSFKIKKIGDNEFKKCWALSNLQPMWYNDNMKKHNTDPAQWFSENPNMKDLYYNNYLKLQKLKAEGK